MANAVEKVNTIAIADIEAINTITDANLQALNTLEFSGIPTFTATEDFPLGTALEDVGALAQSYPMGTDGAFLYRSGVHNKYVQVYLKVPATRFTVIELYTLPDSASALGTNGAGTTAPVQTTSDTLEADSPMYPSIATDPNQDNKGVVTYQQSSDDHQVIKWFVVDPADDSFSYGAIADFSEDALADEGAVALDLHDANKGDGVITWTSWTGQYDISVRAFTTDTGTNAITLGAEQDVLEDDGSATTQDGFTPTIRADPFTTGRYVLSYCLYDAGVPTHGDGGCQIITVSGTTITFGEFEGLPDAVSGITSGWSNSRSNVTFDNKTADKIHHVYGDKGNSWYGTAVCGTIANTDEITWGTPEIFYSGTCSGGSIVSDYFIADAGVIYRETSHSGAGCEAIAWTVSGTDYTFGTTDTFTGTSGTDRGAGTASPFTAGLSVYCGRSDPGGSYASYVAAWRNKIGTYLIGGTYQAAVDHHNE